MKEAGTAAAGRTSITSALPHRLDTERLPCLATRAPAAAAITHAPVLMLTEPMPSPPVPTMSSVSTPASTGTERARSARAMFATSSPVSPWHARTVRQDLTCWGPCTRLPVMSGRIGYE